MGCKTPSAVSPGSEEPLVEESAARSTEPEAAEPLRLRWEPYVEPVEVEDAWTGDESLFAFVEGYALVRGEELTLLRLEDLRRVELPPFAVEDHRKRSNEKSFDLRPRFVSGLDGTWALAWFESDREVSFEIFEADRHRWESAGSLPLPPRQPPQKILPGDEPEYRVNRLGIGLRGDEVVAMTSDHGETRVEHRLDRQTLVWRKVGPESGPARECPMPCMGLDRDIVRWGIGAEQQACAAVRESEADDWVPLDIDELLFVRSCFRIDESKILAAGGIGELTLFPTMTKRADVIDLREKRAHRVEDTPRLGTVVEVPDRGPTWISPTDVVEFDLETETFEVTELTDVLGFGDQYNTIRLDERTVLAYRSREGVMLFGKLGFRQMPVEADGVSAPEPSTDRDRPPRRP